MCREPHIAVALVRSGGLDLAMSHKVLAGFAVFQNGQSRVVREVPSSGKQGVTLPVQLISFQVQTACGKTPQVLPQKGGTAEAPG